jgi:serine O-acetyltransferase
MWKLKQLLFKDLSRQYAMEGRPNVEPTLFLLLCRLPHPRFLPVVICRLSRQAFLLRLPALPGLFTYLNLVLFGIEITPRCEIGPGIFFAHTSGTVIGATRVGANVIIFQGVTLGAKELDIGFSPDLRPIIGDNVTLGSGSKILGGITIGEGSIVGANSVVIKPVSPNTVVGGIPAREIGPA